MDSSERFASDEALQCLVTEGELAKGEIAFASEATLTKPDEIFGRIVFGAIDDAEIFRAAHLQGRLNEAFLAARDELARLYYDAFAAVTGQRFPPCDGIADGGLVGSSRVDLQACKLEYSIVSPK